MLHQTEKIIDFKLEVYELMHWNFNTKGYSLVFDYEKQHYFKKESVHWNVIPSCYKKLYQYNFNSVRKLNIMLKKLGFKKSKYGKDVFDTSLENAIKGLYGHKSRAMCAKDYVVVIKKLHDLESKYVF